MPLSRRKLYDYRDIDRYELLLIRTGHALWRLYKAERAKKPQDVREIGALLEALETVWRIKREYRQNLAIRLAERNAKLREKFKSYQAKKQE